jgi:hypothetical protein
MGIGLTTPMAQHRQKFLRRFFQKAVLSSSEKLVWSRSETPSETDYSAISRPISRTCSAGRAK